MRTSAASLKFGTRNNEMPPTATAGPSGNPSVFRLKIPGLRSRADIGYFEGKSKAALTGTQIQAATGYENGPTNMDILFFQSYKASPTGSCTDVVGFDPNTQCTRITAAATCTAAAEYVRGNETHAGAAVARSSPEAAADTSYPPGCLFVPDGSGGEKLVLNTHTTAPWSQTAPVFCDCRAGLTDDNVACRSIVPVTGSTAATDQACCPLDTLCVYSDNSEDSKSLYTEGSPLQGGMFKYQSQTVDLVLTIQTSAGVLLPQSIAANDAAATMKIVDAGAPQGTKIVSELAFQVSPAIEAPSILFVGSSTISVGESSQTYAFVRLGSRPFGQVAVRLSSTSSVSDRIQMNATSLVFGPDANDWNRTRAVEITPTRNLIQDGDVAVVYDLVPVRQNAEDRCFSVHSSADTWGEVPTTTLTVDVVDDDQGT